jgi:hypothetical protein
LQFGAAEQGVGIVGTGLIGDGKFIKRLDGIARVFVIGQVKGIEPTTMQEMNLILAKITTCPDFAFVPMAFA